METMRGASKAAGEGHREKVALPCWITTALNLCTADRGSHPHLLHIQEISHITSGTSILLKTKNMEMVEGKE